MKTNIDMILELFKSIQTVCKMHVACTDDCSASNICHQILERGPENWNFEDIKKRLEIFLNE